ncbi:hypothetical protein G8O24_43950 [Bradyrhizobium sp. INPA01-394B]|nr:hypothetical protein [Bradyrhizobium campsiandrae]
MQIRNRVVPVVVHLVLLIAAFITLPLGIASAYGEPPSRGSTIFVNSGCTENSRSALTKIAAV